ncbi:MULTISPECIES: DUF3862 domain-containing protein [Pseudoalteromonas]|uniref:DUF3862 domain-containing protein n=1 Tax=Pseudoalteromonas TaxID=53246 RepID=UPI000FFEA724|nr:MULTISPECIES: DUF3862 domain-containing protein [Pseudoalteromonas]MCG9761935.1 outer membrane protein assembly factor BamE [Pseudoalteromonas sp. Isolate6]NKC18702.1 DUF3862 domain-containing protein [Pseudoalteromonas galatheae]RXE84791.1 DUF3862 domain-containing protein [Pseudoalteromonas sp. A757]
MKKLLTAAALLTLAGCSKVSLENYNKIEVGMDKAEVENILGSADKCEEKTLHTNCIWGNENKHIKVTLLSDKVTLYSKKGLE